MLKEKQHLIKAGCLGLWAFLIALSLISYNSLDASLNRASDDEIYNILGVWGSYTADLLIQGIGLSSLLLVGALLLWAKRYIYEHYIPLMRLRIVSLMIAILSGAGVLAFIPTPKRWPLYIGIGGMAGDLIKDFFSPILTDYGTLVLLGAICTITSIFALTLCYNDLMMMGKSIKGAVNYLLQAKFIRKDFFIDAWNQWKKDFFGTVASEEFEEEAQDSTPPVRAKASSKVPETGAKFQRQTIQVVQEKQKKRTTPLRVEYPKVSGNFRLPSLDLLVKAPAQKKHSMSHHTMEQNAKLLKQVLSDFGVEGNITKVRPGPVVTLYELEPSPGTKSSRVIGLADDIARSMSAVSARISVVPGRNVLGIELPNSDREIVYLRELMETEDYYDKRIKLPIALGKDIGGEGVMTDLSRMPHLLVAGTTGSGKSVAVNAMILSFLYRLTPEECRFIMIDPKMLELSVYEGIPHLLAPVVTEPGKAVVALKWTVKEMEERYRAMSYLGVRNIAGYNKKIEDAIASGEQLERQVQTGFHPETGEPIYETQALQMKKLPFIVVIVDEMADLMLTAGKDIESLIQRLAQMARAAGIHMVMATQRPSVDVITGVIKANFPTRISFQVTSRIDSRTILNEMGAEQLLGMGDMLYMAGGTRITRVHGPFVDDKEVDKVVSYLKSQGEPAYIEDITKEDESSLTLDGGNSSDNLYDQAVAIVLRDRKASTSYIQRQLKIGYNRAANLIEEMEKQGVISAPSHSGKREVLVN